MTVSVTSRRYRQTNSAQALKEAVRVRVRVRFRFRVRRVRFRVRGRYFATKRSLLGSGIGLGFGKVSLLMKAEFWKRMSKKEREWEGGGSW